MEKWLELREREQWRALKALQSGGVGGDRGELIRIGVWEWIGRLEWMLVHLGHCSHCSDNETNNSTPGPCLSLRCQNKHCCIVIE